MANKDALWYIYAQVFSVHSNNVTVYIQGIAGHLKSSEAVESHKVT